MSSIKIISNNVKGLNHVIKRKKILTWLKKEKAHIALLQETHLIDTEHEKLKREWVGQVFFSSFNSSKRGVAILINKNTPFILEACIKDTEGRYVIVTGTLYGERITIGCVYAPNLYIGEFYSKLIADISPMLVPYTILSGDFNCVLSPEADHSPPLMERPSKKALTTIEMCTDLNLLDAWRVLHPQQREFTFFSNPHQSLSRIDHIFTSRQVLDRIKDCGIGARTLSDHSPVHICLTSPKRDSYTYQWRLNPTLLSNPEFITFINEQLATYLSINDTGNVNALTLWEAAKAVLRGSIISFSAAKKKDSLKEQLKLEKELGEIEIEMRTHPSENTSRKMAATKSALDELLTQKAETSLLYARHRLYEMGNKPGKLLARLAAGRRESNNITSLIDSSGNKQHETKQLTKIMQTFYEKLYTSEHKPTVEGTPSFLELINTPSLIEEDKDTLCRPITKKEIIETIQSLQSGKAPGPDGYGPDFYKTFSKESLTKIVLGSLILVCLCANQYARKVREASTQFNVGLFIQLI